MEKKSKTATLVGWCAQNGPSSGTYMESIPRPLSTRFKFYWFFFSLYRFKNFILHLSVKLPTHFFSPIIFLHDNPPAILTFPFNLNFISICFNSKFEAEDAARS